MIIVSPLPDKKEIIVSHNKLRQMMLIETGLSGWSVFGVFGEDGVYIDSEECDAFVELVNASDKVRKEFVGCVS